MNPLVALRALSAIALPLAAAIAYFERRRSRPVDDEGHEEPRAEAAPTADRKELRAKVEGGMRLRGADLRGAKLDRLKLADRDLRGADLRNADLRHADLSGARLSGARLDHADLGGCDLRDADLTQASLTETNLWKSDARGANFDGCISLVMANVRGVLYDRTTRWPPGVDPKARGARPVA